MQRKHLILSVSVAALVLFSTGCSSVTRWTPVSATQINANMDRTDYEVLGTTEGKSTKTSFLGPVFQVIDGDKLQVLGIKFFEDQYAILEKPWYSFIVSVEERAYYKALANTPDADNVAAKAWMKTDSGIPILWNHKEVTFQGKALKFKPHN